MYIVEDSAWFKKKMPTLYGMVKYLECTTISISVNTILEISDIQLLSTKTVFLKVEL